MSLIEHYPDLIRQLPEYQGRFAAKKLSAVGKLIIGR
jgi:hypothetical protein